MKFSKSILIFLFTSSILGVFFYALNKTDKNVSKSILFTLYFLFIKIGLIVPNVLSKLDQHRLNPQLVSNVQQQTRLAYEPVYNPYISFLDDYRPPSGLYMDKIEPPVPSHIILSQ
jgi:hypothetical protein